MDRNILIIDFFMEIKKNLSRFLSVLLIVALGVAFFSGIKATKPDMQKTAEVYYDENKLMDLRVVSALGLTSEDLLVVQGVAGIESAVGVYTADVLCEDGENERVLRMRSYTEGVNEPEILEGRMPERAGECLLDKQAADTMGIAVGGIVAVKSGTSKDISETLAETKYIVTGIANSPMYLWRDRDTTTIGNGSVTGFMIVLPEAFSLGYYTEIDATVINARDMDSFSKKYENQVDTVADGIEEIQLARAQIRYDEVYDTAKAQVEQAENELNAAKKEQEDAKASLDAAQEEVDAAKNEINAKLQEVLSGQTTVQEQEASLQQSETALAQVKAQIDATDADLTAKEAALNAGIEQLNASVAQLNASSAQWNQQSEALQVQRQDLAARQEALAQKEAELLTKQEEQDALNEQINALQQQIMDGSISEEEADAQSETLLAQIEALDAEITQAEADNAQEQADLQTLSDNIDAAQAELDATLPQLNELSQQLTEQDAQLAATQTELASARAQLALSQAQYEQQKAALDAGKTALETAKAAVEEGQSGIDASQSEVAAAEAQVEAGKTEYEKNYQESQQKLNDATEELNEKKRELLKMEVPEWNVLDRSMIQSVEGFSQDADRIGAIGNVFPVVFYLVAALVSLTAITRMVDEQRTEIGTLKALGYERHEIAAKYICYALLASVIGGILGAIIGQIVLPRVILHAYRTLYYVLPATKAPMHIGYTLLAVVLAVVCTTLSAFAACYHRLTEAPAQLMRPEAPKAGKQVFLEKWTFLWKHLNFSRKAAIRNMLRYKKRFFMTIFGVAASTALLLVGFGLKNSVNAIGEKQFGELQKYNAEIVLEDTDVAAMTELEEQISQDADIKDYTYVYKTAMDAGYQNTEKSVYLTVVEETERFDSFLNLRNRTSQKKIEIPEEGVVISEKLAKLLGVKKGSTIYLMDNENYRVEVKVTGICENYFRHYVYMSEAQYAALYGGAPVYNEILTINTDKSDAFEEAMSEKYLPLDAVASIQYNSGVQRTIDNVVKNMNVIVIVLIVSAGLLAFVVLYNLNHINITERRRELASIKVLGFYPRELTMYVLRENIVLTVIGIVIGLLFGVFLHRFVILTAELDMMMFGRQIRWTSYVFALLLTIVFSTCVNVIMHFSLKKIDMIESLKSVE